MYTTNLYYQVWQQSIANDIEFFDDSDEIASLTPAERENIAEKVTWMLDKNDDYNEIYHNTIAHAIKDYFNQRK